VFGSPRVAPRVVPVAAPSLSAARAPARGALVIVAAEKKPQKMDSAVKRAKLSEERRMRNKARKSAIATRTKKVCVCAPTCGLNAALAAGCQINGLSALMRPSWHPSTCCWGQPAARQRQQTLEEPPASLLSHEQQLPQYHQGCSILKQCPSVKPQQQPLPPWTWQCSLLHPQQALASCPATPNPHSLDSSFHSVSSDSVCIALWLFPCRC
jgi:hypothetical protein